MSWSSNKDNKWAIGAVAIKPANATLVEFTSFAAHQDAEGVLVKWRTGYEVDNLGFHVYREENGEKTRLTPELVAGSALLAGEGTVLGAGMSYRWRDREGRPKDRYWLQEVDLEGQTTWHGPIALAPGAKGNQVTTGKLAQAMLLSQLGNTEKETEPSSWLGSAKQHFADLPTPTVEQLARQWDLAAQPALKLFCEEEGWYRVGQPDLIAAGLNPSVDPRLLQLFVDGQEQPLVVTGEKDGRFDAGDAIEFYGMGLDEPWTDLRAYWLVVGFEPGRRVSQLPAAGFYGGLGAKISSFPLTLEHKERMLYFPAWMNGDRENFLGPTVGANLVERTFDVHHLDETHPEEAVLEVSLQGISKAIHQVAVLLNGWQVGQVFFKDQELGQLKTSLPPEALSEGDNQITLLSLSGETTDISAVERLRLTYRHTYTCDQERLRFSVPTGQTGWKVWSGKDVGKSNRVWAVRSLDPRRSGWKQVDIEGFQDPGIRVVDVTNPFQIWELSRTIWRQEGSFTARVSIPVADGANGRKICWHLAKGGKSVLTG